MNDLSVCVCGGGGGVLVGLETKYDINVKGKVSCAMSPLF